ncbi:hypothetical protein A4A49_31267 [Nicotiana attenuata]|uniref:Uncharacterized protein n=1 Tax=Nicotiana attenuata TaxID=49451 RepID=A0A1J6KIX2_NICAT|nr:hypothetical protein A4A49_31267 [Nicotiana attenuata]
MDSIRKRKTGFIKGKLVKSLYRAAASPVQYGSSKVKATAPPTYSSEGMSPRTVYHLHLHNHQPKEKLIPYNPNSIIASSVSFSSDAVGFIVNQEQAAPPLKPKVSYYIPPQSTVGSNGSTTGRGTYYGKIDTDESVDLKAANYITSVQERFKLERLNSERKLSPLQSH